MTEKPTLFTKPYLVIAFVVCCLLGIAWSIWFVHDLFKPSDKNRAEMFLGAFSWFYLAGLHWTIGALKYGGQT